MRILLVGLPLLKDDKLVKGLTGLSAQLPDQRVGFRLCGPGGRRYSLTENADSAVKRERLFSPEKLRETGPFAAVREGGIRVQCTATSICARRATCARAAIA